MATTIKLKNSVTTTSVPSSLVQGEVAINITDKKVWVGNAATTPIQLLGGGADGNFTNISVSSVATFGAGTVSAPSITTTGDTNTGIFFPAADTIAFSEGGTEVMRIDSSGRVGIGTSSPSFTLDVRAATSAISAVSTTGTNAAYMFVSNTGGDFYLGRDNSAGSSFGGGAYSANIYSAGAYPMLFWTNGTERMRIDASGNLLVGTTSVSLNGITSSISRNGGSGFNAINSNAGTATYANFQLGNANSANRGGVALLGSAWTTSGITIQDGVYVYSAGNGGLTLASETATPIYFATSSTERMRITSAGNVLIGTTSTGPVNANAITLEPTNSYMRVAHSGTGNGTAYIQFDYNGSSIGSVTQATTSTVAFNTSSDYRLKENITPMTGALLKVAQLKPCTYTWKADGSNGQGFIAHELQEVVPDCVTGEKDGEQMQGVDTSFLVATLTAAIQEQQTLIENLTTRLNALEGK